MCSERHDIDSDDLHVRIVCSPRNDHRIVHRPPEEQHNCDDGRVSFLSERVPHTNQGQPQGGANNAVAQNPMH